MPEAPADELQAQFEPMMAHFKRAQFEPVNSPVYRSPVRLPTGQMTLSPAGAALIKAFESCAIRTSDGAFRTYRDSVNG